MFEDILEKYKEHTEIIIWILEVNGEGRGVEVFNISKNDKGILEGYIKNTTYVIG